MTRADKCESKRDKTLTHRHLHTHTRISGSVLGVSYRHRQLSMIRPHKLTWKTLKTRQPCHAVFQLASGGSRKERERERGGGQGEGRSVCVLADNFWMGEFITSCWNFAQGSRTTCDNCEIAFFGNCNWNAVLHNCINSRLPRYGINHSPTRQPLPATMHTFSALTSFFLIACAKQLSCQLD